VDRRPASRSGCLLGAGQRSSRFKIRAMTDQRSGVSPPARCMRHTAMKRRGAAPESSRPAMRCPTRRKFRGQQDLRDSGDSPAANIFVFKDRGVECGAEEGRGVRTFALMPERVRLWAKRFGRSADRLGPPRQRTARERFCPGFRQIVQRAVFRSKQSGRDQLDLKPDFLAAAHADMTENQQSACASSRSAAVRDMIETGLQQLKSELQTTAAG